MESWILEVVGVIEAALKTSDISDTSLLIIILVSLGYMFKYVLKPMQSNIKQMPTIEDIKEYDDKHVESDKQHVEDINERIARVLHILENVEELSKDNSKDVTELRKDIDVIKQVLTQFQGHMMYGSRRASDYGNKELK